MQNEEPGAVPAIEFRFPDEMKEGMKKYRTVALGVTGGIGSGKTVVCAALAALGAKYIQADRTAKELLKQDGRIIRSVKELLGPASYKAGGAPDTSFISEKIFSSPALRKKLNGIIHPAVIEIIKREVSEGKRSGETPLIVVEAALIYEAGSEDLFDYVAVVDSPEETRVKRLIGRDRLSRDQIMRIISSQMDSGEKLSKADFIIKNDSTLPDLRIKSRFLFSVLAALSEGKT